LPREANDDMMIHFRNKKQGERYEIIYFTRPRSRSSNVITYFT
jgi:hypothetical protein